MQQPRFAASERHAIHHLHRGIPRGECPQLLPAAASAFSHAPEGRCSANSNTSMIGAIERLVARLLKIPERETVQLAGHVACSEEASDHVLRAVGRQGVADHPAIDMAGERCETAFEILHLVPHDHVEAKASGHRCYLIMVLDGTVGHQAGSAEQYTC